MQVRNFFNKNDLKHALKEEYLKIRSEPCHKFIKLKPRLIHSVTEEKGMYIKYIY